LPNRSSITLEGYAVTKDDQMNAGRPQQRWAHMARPKAAVGTYGTTKSRGGHIWHDQKQRWAHMARPKAEVGTYGTTKSRGGHMAQQRNCFCAKAISGPDT